MQFAVDRIDAFDPELVSQIQVHAPRKDLRLDLFSGRSINPCLAFLQHQLVCVLQDEGTLMAFAGLAQDGYFLEQAPCNEIPINKSCYFAHFFVPEYLRGK